MKIFRRMVITTSALLNGGVAVAQNSNMMNQGMWNAGWMGGYGGMWGWILLCVVVIAVLVWIFARKGK